MSDNNADKNNIDLPKLKELVNNLRGIYGIPSTDVVNDQSDRKEIRAFPTDPIQLEAADTIEMLLDMLFSADPFAATREKIHRATTNLKCFPDPNFYSGTHNYHIGCPWCNWFDESDKGSLAITRNYELHIEREHKLQIVAWRMT